MIEKKPRTLAIWEWAHARGGGEFAVQQVNAAFGYKSVASHNALTGLVSQGSMTVRRIYCAKQCSHQKTLFTPTDRKPGRQHAPVADCMKFAVAGRAVGIESLPLVRF